MKTPEEIKKRLKRCEDITHCNTCESSFHCQIEEDALAYINQLEANRPKWISVNAEQKPVHGHEYLCVCSLPDDPKHEWDWMMVLRWYAYGSNGYVDRPHFTDEGVNGMTVTHWMPLPEPQKED